MKIQNPDAAVANFFNSSISEVEIMGPVLDHNNVRILLTDFDCCIQNVQVPFEMVLELYC